MIYIDSNEELLKNLHNAERIYLYGAGLYGRHLALFLEQNGIDVTSFIVTADIDSGKWHGIEINTWKNLELIQADTVIISVSRKKEREILDILERCGLTNVIILSEEMWKYVRTNIDFRKITSLPDEKLIQVLIFHRVSYKQNDPWGLEVTPEKFEEYIRIISSNYPIIRFEDNWHKVQERSIVLTFDDGYCDNYQYALPILEKYNVPATVFVSTGNIGSEREFWWDRIARLLSEDSVRDVRGQLLTLSHEERERQIARIESKLLNSKQASKDDRSLNMKELKCLAASPIITIGAHTVTHSMLSALSKEEQEEEILASKRFLEQSIERPVHIFSYPFGGEGTYNEGTINILKQYGFVKAATNYSGLTNANDDMYQIPRCGIPKCDDKKLLNIIERNWVIYG